jgi:hypothetical protein
LFVKQFTKELFHAYILLKKNSEFQNNKPGFLISCYFYRSYPYRLNHCLSNRLEKNRRQYYCYHLHCRRVNDYKRDKKTFYPTMARSCSKNKEPGGNMKEYTKKYEVSGDPYVIWGKKTKISITALDVYLFILAIVVWVIASLWKGQFAHSFTAAALTTVLLFLIAVYDHWKRR